MGKSRELADFADKLGDDLTVHSSGDITIGYTTSSGEKFGVNGFLGFVGSHGSTPPSTNPSIARINSSDDLGFFTNNNLRAILTGTGDFFLGHSDTFGPINNGGSGVTLRANGQIFAGHTGPALYINREDSNGDSLVFREDGAMRGSIGVRYNSTYVAGVGSGVLFNGNGLIPANSTGSVTDNTYDLGQSGVRWDDVYATNGTIQTSDRNEKQDIEELSEAETRVAQACKGLLRKFRWVDAVEKKGDDARIHFGIIAQDLRDAFTAEGLDAGDYAMFISTTWFEDEEGQTHEEQNELGTLTERARLGVRYPELLAFIIASL